MRHSSRVSPSIFTVILCLVCLTGCKWLIPENPSAPRYNTVLGGKRTPALNRPAGADAPYVPGPGSQAMPPAGALAPAVVQAAPAYPPVSVETQAMAEQRISEQQMATPPSAPPPQERGFWDRMAFWRSDEPQLQVSAAVQPTMEARRMPPENVMQGAPVDAVQVADNSAYPKLSAVPPRPQSDAERLASVRSQLEQERATANQSSTNLSAAAAAEPSLLAPMPEPVSVNTLPPPPKPMMESVAPPSYTPAMSAPLAAAPLPPIVLKPPPAAPALMPTPTPMPVAAIPAYQPTYTPPPVTAGMEPIMLRAPVPQSAPSPSFAAGPPAYTSSTPAAMPPAAAGGFNPMAGTAASAYDGGQQLANGSGYLPPSRYIQRRVQ